MKMKEFTIQVVNAQIALFLSVNKVILNIEDKGITLSLNVFNTDSSNEKLVTTA